MSAIWTWKTKNKQNPFRPQNQANHKNKKRNGETSDALSYSEIS